MYVYTDTITANRPDYLGGGQWVITGLTGATVIFGKNGSGKSLLLRAYRDSDPARLHYIAPERIGNLSAAFGVAQSEMDGGMRQQASQRNVADEYRSRVASRVVAFFLKRGALATKSNFPREPAELELLLNRLLPDFEVKLSANAPYYSLQRVGTAAQVGNADQLSSGEAQLLTLGLDIVTVAAIWELETTSPRILLIDEPDAHLHPDLQVRFADFLNVVATEFKLQAVISTHSPALLAAMGQFGGLNTSVVYFSRAAACVAARPFDASLKQLAACLGGNVLMGSLFSVPLLLVEGDDDYRIWSQVPRHHRVNLAVIPSNGHEIFRFQETLERLFSSMCTYQGPLGYALVDSDHSIPAPTGTNPQQFVPFLQLQCHEAENLFFADEVLAEMATTWPAA